MYDQYGNWALVVLWILLFGIFILFIPFHQKTQRKPASVYLAFVVALAFEMFGIPLSIFFVTWLTGLQLQGPHVSGHTLYAYIGLTGMWIGSILDLIGIVLVISGWGRIHASYWSKPEGERRLVTDGVYRYMRHPQYTGLLLITLGLLVHWATIPTLIMWPILVVLYYRLARREEQDMEREFGIEFTEYKAKVPMFIPIRIIARR